MNRRHPHSLQRGVNRRTVLAGLAVSLPLVAGSGAPAQPNLAAPVIPGTPGATPVQVTVEGRNILVDGQPFLVRGVAGDGPLAQLPGLG
ncbi:MAG: hypothetical protein E2577_02130, partial [Starkeya sp.]|nr:hypothetical protein [Starkeya sp.]